MILEDLRKKVLDTALMLPEYRLVWMAGGTVCAKDPESGLVAVTPSGMKYQNLQPEDIIVTDLKMKVVDGNHKPSIALRLWINFLNARDEINAVIHTHSPYATAFSVVHKEIPATTETMANWFGGSIPVTRYLSVDDPEFDTLPVEVLGKGFAVNLGNHGPIVLGESLDRALERAVTLEESAHTSFISFAIGTPQLLSTEQLQKSFSFYHTKYGQ